MCHFFLFFDTLPPGNILRRLLAIASVKLPVISVVVSTLFCLVYLLNFASPLVQFLRLHILKELSRVPWLLFTGKNDVTARPDYGKKMDGQGVSL